MEQESGDSDTQLTTLWERGFRIGTDLSQEDIKDLNEIRYTPFEISK